MTSRFDLGLEPLGPAHAAAMFRWMQDPEVRQNVGVRETPTLERTEQWIARAQASDTVRAFAVVAGGRHVGNVILDEIDGHLGQARLSVYLGERRGEGLGRAAVRLALLEAFGPLGLHKIWLTLHARNERAKKIYLSLGFVEEGRLREEFLLDGERLDAVRMGIFARELAE